MRLALAAIILALVTPMTVLAASEGEKKAFVKADTNHDKQIDRAEFVVLINELAAIGAEKALTVKKWGVYGIGFKRADANGDGVISIPELKAQK